VKRIGYKTEERDIRVEQDKTTDVNVILPGIDGMLHISQISDKRVEKVTDVLSQDQEVWVKLDKIDEKGRLNLTMKGVKQ
jgi:polyribonucleotide nucleotidyltransferase